MRENTIRVLLIAEHGLLPDAVQVMTVHQAKVMQWPAVFVPCLRKNRFPARRQGGRSVWHVIPESAVPAADRYKGSEEDKRRLFYVALTRAERYLVCTWAPIESNSRAQRVSTFFQEFTEYEGVLRETMKAVGEAGRENRLDRLETWCGACERCDHVQLCRARE